MLCIYFITVLTVLRVTWQDWEDGLSENDADGSFLHENWNKDLKLFDNGEDGGSQLLQVFSSPISISTPLLLIPNEDGKERKFLVDVSTSYCLFNPAFVKNNLLLCFSAFHLAGRDRTSGNLR